MISIRFLYLILLLGSFIFYIMYIDLPSSIMLTFLILIPIVSYILFVVSRKKLKISILTNNDVIFKNEAMFLNIIINNKGIIPISRIDVEISYKNELLNIWESFTVSSSARANNIQKLSSVIKSEYCGTINVKISKVKVYDLLFLFKKTYGSKKLTSSENFVSSLVFPSISEVDVEIKSDNLIDYESEYLSKTKKGDDPSEIFDFHEYKPGDKLNRIHWKLSAKTDEIYVKDFSLPISHNTTLLFNNNLINKNNISNSLTLFDIAAEALVSISYALCEEEVIHNIIYYDNNSLDFSKYVVTDLNECHLCMSQLLKTSSQSDKSVIIEYLNSVISNNQQTVYFTDTINKNELEAISQNENCNVTVIASTDLPYDCYPLDNSVKIIFIKEGNVSKSIEKLVI